MSIPSTARWIDAEIDAIGSTTWQLVRSVKSSDGIIVAHRGGQWSMRRSSVVQRVRNVDLVKHAFSNSSRESKDA